MEPSRKRALGQFRPSRNRRAKSPNETAALEMAKIAVWGSRTPTPLRTLSEGPEAEKRGVDFAVDDQHGAGLGGEVCARLGLQKLGGFHDACGIGCDVEHAVGLHVEVAGAACSVGFFELLAILDVEANRGAVGVIHACVHGHHDGAAGSVQGAGEGADVAIRDAAGVFPV